MPKRQLTANNRPQLRANVRPNREPTANYQTDKQPHKNLCSKSDRAPLDFCATMMYNRAMLKNLRIAFSIIAVIFAAAAVFVFVYAGLLWGFLCVAGVVVFFLLTLLCKRKMEQQELKDNPPPPVGDFITGKVKHDDGTDSTDNKDNDSDAR